MAITIDWGSKVISVPQSFLTLLSGTNYTLDTNAFHIALKDLEDSEDGIAFPPTHRHNTVVTLGGIQYARVIEMINGYTITFENGAYSVSLIGSNNNILDVVNLNQVSIRANNSAGLINIAEVQMIVFNNGVTVDVANGYSGTLYPTGTPLRPSNNIVDAVAIAQERGFKTLYIRGSLTLDTGDNVSYMALVGENASRTMIILNPGAETTGVEIVEAAVTGTLDGSVILRRCYVFEINYINGFIYQCQLAGTFTIGGANPATVMSCYGGTGTLTIDMAGSGKILNMLDWSGRLNIANKTGADVCRINVSAGVVTLNSNVTNGAGIHIEGIGTFINSSLVTPDYVEMLSGANIAAATIAAAQVTPIYADTRRMNGATVLGNGTLGNQWRGE